MTSACVLSAGQVLLLLSPGHSSKGEFWQPFSPLCSRVVGNDWCSHGLFLDSILFFGTSIFVFMPDLGLLNLLLIISFSLSAQLTRCSSCPYIDTVVSTYVPIVITCINSLLVLNFSFLHLC